MKFTAKVAHVESHLTYSGGESAQSTVTLDPQVSDADIIRFESPVKLVMPKRFADKYYNLGGEFTIDIYGYGRID